MKLSRVSYALGALALILLLTLVACGGSEEVVQEVDAEEALFEGIEEISHGQWEAGKKGGTFTMSLIGSDPKTFSVLAASESSSNDVLNRMYSAAVTRNQHTLEWETGIAESYSFNDDETVLTVELMDGLLWSDGEPLTASDFVFTAELIFDRDIETNSRSGLIVAGEDTVWTVVNDTTFTIEFPSVYAGALNAASIAPVPEHIFRPIYEEGGAEAVNTFWGVDTDVTTIVGNGPFVMKEYVPGQRIVLGPNPNYYETDENGVQLPYIDELVMVLLADQDTELQRFLAGDLDFLGIGNGEQVQPVMEAAEELGVTLYNVGPVSSTQFITFNMNPIEGEEDLGLAEPKVTWNNNVIFRRAMAHLVDRETIVNNIAFGYGFPQYSFIPRVSPFYWEGADAAAPAFDPAAAAELLDSIDYVDRDGDGWREDPEGNKISLELTTNSGNRVREAIGTLFAKEARNVGIEINFRPKDFNVMVNQLLSTYDWEMILIGLTGSVDPISGANVYPSSGNLHMVEPLQESPRREWEKQVDEAWDLAALTTDEEVRKGGYETIQRLWIQENPWIYTYNAASIYAVKNQWGNIYAQPVDGFDWEGIIHRIYIKD